MNSLRDEMKDAIRSELACHFKIDETEVDADLVGSMADTVFGVMEIPESEQDMDHEKWLARKA
jgi:hypothetical protein